MGLELASCRTCLMLTRLNSHCNPSKSQFGIPITPTTYIVSPVPVPRLQLPHQQQPLRRLHRLPSVISGVSAPNQVLLCDVIFAFIYPCFLKQCRPTLLTCFLLLLDEDLVAYQFEIFNIIGWSTDGGAALHQQEDGCGALTFWTWNDATSSEAAYVYFNLPFFIKAGCVERASVSAGGPQLSCQGQGTEFPFPKRSLGPRAAANAALPVPQLAAEKLHALQIIYRNNTGSYQSYVPMNWTAPNSS